MASPKQKQSPKIDYSGVFDEVLSETDGDLSITLKRIIADYSRNWHIEKSEANDIVKDKQLTANAILDCLNVLLEVSDQTVDFKRAVYVLTAKVKKHEAKSKEEKLKTPYNSYDDETDFSHDDWQEN